MKVPQSVFVTKNAVYVWMGEANREKNLRFQKYPDMCGRDLYVKLWSTWKLVNS